MLGHKSLAVNAGLSCGYAGYFCVVRQETIFRKRKPEIGADV